MSSSEEFKVASRSSENDTAKCVEISTARTACNANSLRKLRHDLNLANSPDELRCVASEFERFAEEAVDENIMLLHEIDQLEQNNQHLHLFIEDLQSRISTNSEQHQAKYKELQNKYYETVEQLEAMEQAVDDDGKKKLEKQQKTFIQEEYEAQIRDMGKENLQLKELNRKLQNDYLNHNSTDNYNLQVERKLNEANLELSQTIETLQKIQNEKSLWLLKEKKMETTISRLQSDIETKLLESEAKYQDAREEIERLLTELRNAHCAAEKDNESMKMVDLNMQVLDFTEFKKEITNIVQQGLTPEVHLHVHQHQHEHCHDHIHNHKHDHYYGKTPAKIIPKTVSKDKVAVTLGNTSCQSSISV